MDGLARTPQPDLGSASQVQRFTIDNTNFTPQNIELLDFYNYFQLTPNVSPREDIGRIDKIYGLLDGETIGDKMMALRKVDEYLGYPHPGESQVRRVEQWLSYKRAILELTKKSMIEKNPETKDRIKDLSKRQQALSRGIK